MSKVWFYSNKKVLKLVYDETTMNSDMQKSDFSLFIHFFFLLKKKKEDF